VEEEQMNQSEVWARMNHAMIRMNESMREVSKDIAADSEKLAKTVRRLGDAFDDRENRG
jgi:hypothetical protein